MGDIPQKGSGVHPSPDLPAIRQFLDWLASRVPDSLRDGLIEIAYNGKADGGPNKARLFGLDELGDAAEFAERMNGRGKNVWIGAALRRPDAPRDKRAGNKDFYAALAVPVDIDRDASTVAAKLNGVGASAGLIVTTGTIPGLRLQKWHALTEPCADGEAYSRAVKAVVAHAGGDPGTADAARLMRLGGTISYPDERKRERGYATELTTIARDSEAPPVPIERFLGLGSSSNPFTEFGKQAIVGGGFGSDPIQRLNSAALADIGAWVYELFPSAKPQQTGGFRVSSKDLGRKLEEDLSIHPDGIKDFGLHDQKGEDRDGRRTPVDLVMEYGGKDFDGAVAWLRERLKLPDDNDDKPTIKVRAGELDIMATLGEEALLASGVQLYQRSNSLVRPIISDVEAAHGQRTKVAQLVRIDAVYMRDLLCRHATWLKPEGRSRGKAKWVQTNPPPEAAPTILARVGEWKFKDIGGVISTPTMRPDGTILSNEGYDEATRLLLLAPPQMPPIPDRPTRKDALASLALLKDLIAEFPFVSDVDRAVALSGIITPVVRGAFTVAPMHCARAPTSGSGKSYLWDVAAAIAIGHKMPTMAAGRTEEETEKRLGAALLTGQPLISLDNVNGELGGDALCQIVERPLVEVRILGKSERVRIEARGTTVYCTGNNIVIVGDLCRRVLTATLDPKVENPEERQFGGDPVGQVLSDRGKYVAAARRDLPRLLRRRPVGEVEEVGVIRGLV
jgi:hypothetical protein